MGVLFKSVVGLGAVYFAMFGPVLKTADVGQTASLCSAVAQARWTGDETFRAQLAAAGCAVKIAAEAERLAKAAPPKPLPPPKAAPPPAPAPKVQSGTLTEADLAEPWFGPSRPQRKTASRG